VTCHRLWKDEFIQTLSPQPGIQLLDLAGGTADIAFRAAAAARALEKPGEQSAVGTAITVCDINEAMLAVGRQRAAERGEGRDYLLDWVTADAEKLPFDDASFDAVTISFGIRNVTRIDAALREAHRVLRHGGRFLCLEFGPNLDTAVLDDLYQAYSFSLIPSIGQMIVGDRQPYVSVRNAMQVSEPAWRKFQQVIPMLTLRMAAFELLRNILLRVSVAFRLQQNSVA
jgi:2-methoxy-6-polyprenyl-1,4-benzoquinol methylase